MNNQHYVINTFSYIWKRRIDDCIQHLVELGFQAFEILIAAPHLWPSEFDTAARRSLSKLLRRCNSRVVSLNAGGFDNNLVSPAKDARVFAQSYLTSVLDLAADLDAPYVVMSPGIPRPLLAAPREWMLGWFRDSMENLVRHAEGLDTKLLIENIPFAFLPRAEDLMAALTGLPSDRVGVIYDVANAVFVREDPVAGLEAVASRLELVHLSDTPLDIWRHDAVGRGIVPFERFGAALRDLRYQGPVVLEIVSKEPDTEIMGSVKSLAKLGWN